MFSWAQHECLLNAGSALLLMLAQGYKVDPGLNQVSHSAMLLLSNNTVLSPSYVGSLVVDMSPASRGS